MVLHTDYLMKYLDLSSIKFTGWAKNRTVQSGHFINYIYIYKKKDLKLPQWMVTSQMDCMKIRFFPYMKGALNPCHRSPSQCTKYLNGPLPQGRSTHWNIRRRISRAHVAALFMCLESEWESLGWIATHPNPLSNNVRCGGRINLFFGFSCFLAIVITLRLSYIGAWALKASPAWRNTKKKKRVP